MPSAPVGKTARQPSPLLPVTETVPTMPRPSDGPPVVAASAPQRIHVTPGRRPWRRPTSPVAVAHAAPLGPGPKAAYGCAGTGVPVGTPGLEKTCRTPLRSGAFGSPGGGVGLGPIILTSGVGAVVVVAVRLVVAAASLTVAGVVPVFPRRTACPFVAAAGTFPTTTPPP